jgi:mono/diheme cytochrome c family protein
MARYKRIDTSPRFIAVDLERQLLPGTFEHALNHLIDHELDLTSVDARYQNDLAGASAYPPGLLPARSWSRIMNGLDRHYGTDASLDAATVQQISQWLQAHAGSYKRVSAEPPQDRITRSAWFERKHRKLDAPVWQLASVKSAANCAACHTRAEQGSFDEDELQFPRGLDARYRRAFQD